MTKQQEQANLDKVTDYVEEKEFNLDGALSSLKEEKKPMLKLNDSDVKFIEQNFDLDKVRAVQLLRANECDLHKSIQAILLK